MSFDPALTSSSEIVYAVFQLPAYAERTGEGQGGGPGLGFVKAREQGSAYYVSKDGSSWTRLHPDYSIRAEVMQVLARGSQGNRSLAELKETRPKGWWDQVAAVDSTDEESDGLTDATPVVSADRPLAVLPNPFNPRTEVQFYVAEPGHVQIDVFDVRGRRVRAFLRGEYDAGVHQAIWHGMDDGGASVSSGVYFLLLSTPSGAHIERAALVR